MATEILRPSGAGWSTQLTKYGDDANWKCVDDSPGPDEGSTFVYRYVYSYARDLYVIPAHSEGSGTINSVKIYFRCIYYQQAGKAKPSLRSNAQTVDGTEITPTGSWVTYSQQWNTNPTNEPNAWTWDDIDALEIGVSLIRGSAAGEVECTQVYVEVDYTPPAVVGRSWGVIIG